MGYVTGKGGANAICDVCGFQYKNFELKRRWDGWMVCEDDWETRHPQEFIRPVPDSKPLPWTRPEVLVTEVDMPSIYGVVDLGAVDYALVGFDLVS